MRASRTCSACGRGASGGVRAVHRRGAARGGARARGRARDPARPTSRRACIDWDDGEEVERARAREDELPRRARGRDRRRRDAAARASRRRDAHPRRGRDREARQPRRDGAHRGRRRRGRAARRRRACRPVEPERDPRVDGRRLHAPDRRGDARRSVQRAAAPEGRRRRSARRPRTPTPTYARPTASSSAPRTRACRDAWRDAADVHVAIPMRGRTADSLNASDRRRVLLFEALRQRG